MPVTRVTTVQQRQEMAYRVAQGAPYQTVAYQNQVSYWTVRKWARPFSKAVSYLSSKGYDFLKRCQGHDFMKDYKH